MTLQTASQLAFTNATSSSDFDHEFLAMTNLSVISPSNVLQKYETRLFRSFLLLANVKRSNR
jgi:hypothetical protein